MGLWQAYNHHIAAVMESADRHAVTRVRASHNLHELAWKPVPRTEPTTLDYFMRDYVAHLEHHLRQALGDGWQALKAYRFGLRPPNSARGPLPRAGPARCRPRGRATGRRASKLSTTKTCDPLAVVQAGSASKSRPPSRTNISSSARAASTLTGHGSRISISASAAPTSAMFFRKLVISR